MKNPAQEMIRRLKKQYQPRHRSHDWQRDGQTMTAIRWACTKCGKSQLMG